MFNKNYISRLKFWIVLFIFAIAQSQAWSFGKSTDSNANHIQDFKWTQQISNTHTGLNDIDFFDQNHGMAVGDSGILCLTRDGGETWQANDFSYVLRQRFGDDYWDLIDGQMVSQNIGFFIGIAGGGNCTIQKINLNNLTLESKYQTSTQLYDLFFLNNNIGWAVGQEGTVYYSSTGFDKYKDVKIGNGMDLYGVYFVDPDTGWVVGDNGTIMKSVDGGKTWQAQVSNFAQPLYAVQFINSQDGWAIGHDGAGVRTLDGGTTWNNFATGDMLDCYAVHFLNDSTGWSAGLNGSVYTTTDSGSTWNAEILPASDTISFYGLAVQDQEHIWVAGDGGTILHRSLYVKPVLPDPVTNLQVRSFGTNFISLVWQNPADNWSYTEIWRDSATNPQIPDTSAGDFVYQGDGTAFSDQGVSPNRRYYYSAFAINAKQDTFSLGQGAQIFTDTYPMTVSNFRAEGTGTHSIYCHWDNPQDSTAFDSVKVVRGKNGFPNSPSDTSAVLVYKGRKTSFTDTTGLKPGTGYYYAAFTIGFSGLANTGENAMWKTSTQSERPGPISRFSATAREPRSVFLQWRHPVQNWTRTEIWVSTKNYPQIPDTTQGKRVYSGTDTTATDTTARPNRTYYYSAFALDGSNQHSVLNNDSRAMTTTFPAQVTNFLASPINANTIECTWTAPAAADFDSLKVFRTTSSYKTNLYDGSGTLIYAGRGNRFTDTYLFPDSTYYYSVFTIGSTKLWQTPAVTARGSARTPKATAKPDPVSDLSATVLSPYSISLTWRNPLLNFVGTRIMRRPDNFPQNPQDGVIVYQGRGTSFVDTRLSASTTYYYAAFAYNSQPSFSDLGTTSTTRATTVKANPPAAIQSFKARPVSHTALRLSWRNPASNYAGTVIRRSTSHFPVSEYDGREVYSGKDTVFVDNGVKPYITYFYTAFAYNNWYEYSSANASARDSSKTLVPPNAPRPITNFIAHAIGPRLINLSWDNPESDTLYYLTEIRRDVNGYPVSPDQGIVVYKNNGKNKVDSDQQLIPGTRYYYSAFAYSNKDQYAWPTFATTITWGQTFNWSTMYNHKAPLSYIYFFNSKTGWSVGPNGALLFTSDGGVTWRTINIDKRYTIRHIYFYDLKTGWCTGTFAGKDLVLITSDGGTTWKPIYPNLSRGLNSVYFYNNLIGWAVGEDGVILKTIDGGQTWKKVNFNHTAGINAVQFINSLTGWAVSSSGAILYTLDGGITWSTFTNIVTHPLRYIKFFDSRYGWAVGDKGTLIYTSDGGSTWNYSAINDTFDIRNVHFVNSNIGFIIADTDKILKTLDGGRTWTVESQGSGVRFASFSFVDDKTGYVVAENGDIIQLKFSIAAPASITGLKAIQKSTSSAQLTWRKPASLPAGMTVIRNTNGFPANVSDGVQAYSGLDTTFTDTSLRAGTMYYYSAFAYNSQGAYSSAQASAQASIILSDYLGPFGFQPNIAGIDIERYPNLTAFVSVVDTVNRKMISDLTAANLKVLDDSVQVGATVNKLSSTNSANLDLVFVVDATASMVARVDTLARNITALADSFKAAGLSYQFASVAFGDSVREILQFTQDALALKNWLKGLPIKGGANPQDNVLEGLARAAVLPRRENAIRVLILLTDAEFYEWGMPGDGTTFYTTNTLIKRLQEQFITAHIIGPQKEKHWQIASGTGGFNFDIASGVSRALDQIRQILTKIYVVKYTSPQINTADSWHKLTVIANKDNKGGIDRSRYYVGPTTLRVNPINFMAIKGMVFQVELSIAAVLDLKNAAVTLKYRGRELQLLTSTIVEGDFLKSGNGNTRFTRTITDSTIMLDIKRLSAGGVNGSGVLVTMQFKVLDSLVTKGISIFNYSLVNSSNVIIPANILNSQFKSALTDKLIADFDGDLDIDTRDFALFATYWKPVNNPAGDIGPAAGSAPFLTPAQDAQVNFEDLFVFTQMWNWYHATFNAGSLSKTGSEPTRLMLKPGKRDASKSAVPVEWVIENSQNLAMAHVRLQYNPGQYRLGRINPGSALQAEGANVSFFVNEDAASGLIEISTTQLLERGVTGFSGTGTLAVIELEPLSGNDLQLPTILEATVRDGANQDQVFEIVNDPASSQLPKTTELYANYPNPFNPVTNISFDLAKIAQVELRVYNLLGQQVRTLVNKRMEPGRYQLLWDGRDDAGHVLASGMYIYRLEAGDHVQVRRMVLLK